MSDLISKAAIAPAAMFDESQGCLLIRVSSDMPDRDDEVVIPSTLDLTVYKPNPVILAFHDQHRVPIAKCEDASGKFECWVDGDDLWQRWWFDASGEGAFFQGLYRRKVMRGASIGFRTFGVDAMRPEESEIKYGIRKTLNIHRGGELLETSAVPVPSCPAALAIEWVDSEALASVVSRGYVGSAKGSELVLKHLAPFAARLDTFRVSIAPDEKVSHKFPTPKVELGQDENTPAEAPEMSQATTAPETSPAPVVVETTTKAAVVAPVVTPAVVTTAAPAVVTKADDEKPADNDSDTTNDEDAEGEDSVGSHEQVKAGLENAMHECMAAFHKGEMEWEDAKSALDLYAGDHAKYSGKSGDGETEEEEASEDDPPADDSDSSKSFQATVLKFIKDFGEWKKDVEQGLELAAEMA